MPQDNNESILIVDLDGTLIKSDLLVESSIRLIKKNPLYIFLLIIWLFRGKAKLKNEIASRIDIRVDLLPYRTQIIEKIKSHTGKKVLATAAHYKYANAVANYLEIFDDVLASDEKTNLKGNKKVQFITERYGETFDYIGDSSADIPIWQKANKKYVVSPNNSLKNKLKKLSNIEFINENSTSTLKSYLNLLRVHQWTKNLLLFLPLIGAHNLFNFIYSFKTLVGVLSFSLCASSVYLLNDIFDLEEDRLHRTKKNRSIANGSIKISSALIVIPLLVVFSTLIALFLDMKFLLWLFVYYVLTLAYTIFLKRIVILDMIMLTSLYIIRIISGSVINNIKITFWFLAFAVFLFFSLAIIKRFVEVNESEHTAQKRGYQNIDINLISISGITSSYISVLIMMLYLYNHSNSTIEKNPLQLLILCLIMLYGYTRLWMLAFRRQVNEDPVVFILKDTTSLVLTIISGLIIFYLT